MVDRKEKCALIAGAARGFGRLSEAQQLTGLTRGDAAAKAGEVPGLWER